MTLKDEAKAKLWARGELSWKLHSAQKKVKAALDASTEKLFVGNCSRQFGKSYLMASVAIETAIKGPNRRIKYAAAFQTDLKEFIIPSFVAVLADCPAALRPIYKSSGSKFVFTNGSEIKLLGVDKNPDGLRGNTIDLIILDECGFMRNLESLYRDIILPATTHRPNARIIMISTPPKSPGHDFKMFAEKAEIAGNYAVFTIYDNPMLSVAQMDQLAIECGGKESTTFRREYLCEFITDSESSIIPEFTVEKAAELTQIVERPPFFDAYVALDVGFKDLTAVLFAYWDFQNARLVIEDEFSINRMTTQQLADGIKAKEKALWGMKKPLLRVSDTDLRLIHDLTVVHGINVQATPKDDKETAINAVRLMIGAGKVVIHPRCINLLAHLKYGIWNASRTTFDRSQDHGHYDFVDALVYLVRSIRKHRNPVPESHGITFDHVITADHSLTKTEKTLTALFGPKQS